MSRAPLRSIILGTGAELPSKVVTNYDLEKMVDTSDEWITVRTGIKERRILEEGKGNADMALEAAKRALADAGMVPADLDAIIMATVARTIRCRVPRVCLRTSLARAAYFFRRRAAVGISRRLVCSGLFYLDQKIRTALVVGFDALEPDARSARPWYLYFFGDGAGAVVLAP